MNNLKIVWTQFIVLFQNLLMNIKKQYKYIYMNNI